jgi:hypothetical protein
VRHLTPEEFVDAAEGQLAADRRRHLAGCEACRCELTALVALMREASDEPVPEPSPLFWDHFSARVGSAVRAEGRRPAGAWTWWLQRPALIPMAALAIIVVAAVATVPWGRPPVGIAPGFSTRGAPAAGIDEATGDNAGWSALAELVGPFDWETAGAAGLSLAPGETDLGLMDLTVDERRELSRLIAGELARVKS